MIPGYEWYPIAVQAWIAGTGLVAAFSASALWWWVWGRPLRSARVELQELDALRHLRLLEAQQRIDRIVAGAEAEMIDLLFADRVDSHRPDNRADRSVIDVHEAGHGS